MLCAYLNQILLYNLILYQVNKNRYNADSLLTADEITISLNFQCFLDLKLEAEICSLRTKKQSKIIYFKAL